MDSGGAGYGAGAPWGLPVLGDSNIRQHLPQILKLGGTPPACPVAAPLFLGSSQDQGSYAVGITPRPNLLCPSRNHSEIAEVKRWKLQDLDASELLLLPGGIVYSPHSSQREPLFFLFSKVFKFVDLFFLFSIFFPLKIKKRNSQNIK